MSKKVSLYGYVVNKLLTGGYLMRARGGNGTRKTLVIAPKGDNRWVVNDGKDSVEHVSRRAAFAAAHQQLNPGKSSDPTRPLPPQPSEQ